MRTHVVGSWSAVDTPVSGVEEAIRRLRQRHDRGAVRTAVASLVVLVGEDRAEAANVIDVVRKVAARNPIRAVVVSTSPDDAPGIGAQVTVMAAEGDGGSRVFCEDVLLHVRGPATRHLQSVVGPCTLRGVPLITWIPTRLWYRDDELVAAADRILVDTTGRDPVSTFSVALELNHRRPVTDLSWVRLEPWRRVIGRLLSGPAFASFPGGVRRIEFEGEPGHRSLLTGWLTNRLDADPDAVHLVDGDQPTLRIWAEHDGRRMSVTVDSPTGSAQVHGVARLDGRGPPRTAVRANWTPAAILEGALNRPARDAQWEDAVAAALRLTVRG